MTLLLAVLALSYVGGMLMGGRALRGYGLPSGSEWVLLGIALGPHVLGSVEVSVLRAFDPIAAMGVAWLSFVHGAGIARAVRRAGARAALLGVALALASGGAVLVSVYLVGAHVLALDASELRTLAIGAALVSCTTTRHAVGWVVQRYGAAGPLSERIAGLSAADDAVPLLVMAVPFALTAPSNPYSVTWWELCLLTLALGALLGITSAVLLRVEASTERMMGVLLGAALLGTGIAWRLGLSALAAMLVLGMTLALLSGRREELGRLLGRAEHIVLLPALLLAGASLRWEASWAIALLLTTACAARLLVRVLVAPLLTTTIERAQRPGFLLSLGLMPTGGLTVCVGLAFTLRFPGVVGELVLATAIAQTLLGELLGPAALRLSLQRAGEIAADDPSTNDPNESAAEPAR